MKNRYRFRRAQSKEDFEQIFRLNHDVFAGELEQYSVDPSGRLVDKFHDKNTYLIALCVINNDEDHLIGMLAIHDQPPFSVAAKLPGGIHDAHATLTALGRLMEVRMLAVEPAHRNGRVMAGLMLQLYEHARTYDTIVISGHSAKAGMYHEFGFQDLGPAVKSGEATYIPMAVRVAALAERQARWERRLF
jgi:GNAT superfamily N-acetyltransferase